MSVSRVELHKQLPLETPFSVHIFPIYACNFKCKYCLHSLGTDELAAKGFKKEIMDFTVFKKTVDDIKEHNSRIKAMIFAGHGEPLLHKDIAGMVKYAKESGISGRVEITTNGSLLDRKMADALIDVGLDRLKISIQGTRPEKYQDISGFNIDFDKFLSDLRYFYNNKKHTEVYIKIIDIALDGKDDEDTFKNMFAPVADDVNIEYAIPFIKELDKSVYNKSFDRSKQGNTKKSNICSMPFYMQVIAPNGDVLPCCSTDIPVVLGNVMRNTLQEIWNSKSNNDFLRMMLHDRNTNKACKSCSVPAFGLQDGDYLDEYKDELLAKYQKVNA